MRIIVKDSKPEYFQKLLGGLYSLNFWIAPEFMNYAFGKNTYHLIPVIENHYRQNSFLTATMIRQYHDDKERIRWPCHSLSNYKAIFDEIVGYPLP